MDPEINYGDLSYSIDLVENTEQLKNDLIEIKEVLDQLLPLKAHYNTLSLPVKIELDLFLLFALNSLQWIKLQVNGMDPTRYPVAGELQRVKIAMIKWQQECDRQNRPRLDIPVVRRFIRGGLHIRNVGYQPYTVKKPTNNNTNQDDRDEL
ncbi:Nuclear nucleic acid-binding protein C1D [Papilio machaon]|uniref:Nuclear nucleic acid-binding protein C1D n=1 Tax=Papilio machaon TaxID=76193 RepID=A0A0N1IG38_PAPMA|nr:Nuclear nucleic acid-binding protein C1D [Papilio machaon]